MSFVFALLAGCGHEPVHSPAGDPACYGLAYWHVQDYHQHLGRRLRRLCRGSFCQQVRLGPPFQDSCYSFNGDDACAICFVDRFANKWVRLHRISSVPVTLQTPFMGEASAGFGQLRTELHVSQRRPSRFPETEIPP